MDKINLEKLVNDALEYAKSFENDGKVASYIPELSFADKNALGVCIVANNNAEPIIEKATPFSAIPRITMPLKSNSSKIAGNNGTSIKT